MSADKHAIDVTNQGQNLIELINKRKQSIDQKIPPMRPTLNSRGSLIRRSVIGSCDLLEKDLIKNDDLNNFLQIDSHEK